MLKTKVKNIGFLVLLFYLLTVFSPVTTNIGGSDTLKVFSFEISKAEAAPKPAPKPSPKPAPTGSSTVIDGIVDDNGNIKINSSQNGLQKGLAKTKYLVYMFMAFSLLICSGLFIFALTRVAAAQSNGATRGEALKGVMWVLIAIAGIGSFTLIVGVAYNSFN